jgi:hypothetical protein
MIAMQLHTFLKEGTKIPDDKYREAFRLILDDVEQELDALGQLGPLSLAKIKEFGAKLRVTLQSRGLSEVPPKATAAAVNELAGMQARLRKLESGGGGEASRQAPSKQDSARCRRAPSRRWSWERAWQWGESVLFIGTQFSNLYTAVDTPAMGRVVKRARALVDKSPQYLRGNVSCVGKWAASRRRAPKAIRMRKRSMRKEKPSVSVQTCRSRFAAFAVDVSVDEVVSDEENAEQSRCLLPPHVSSNLPLSNPELSPEVP